MILSVAFLVAAAFFGRVYLAKRKERKQLQKEHDCEGKEPATMINGTENKNESCFANIFTLGLLLKFVLSLGATSAARLSLSSE